MGTKRERIASFNVQRPVNWDEKAVQKILDREGFVYVDIKYDGVRGVIYYDQLSECWRVVTRENIEIVSITARINILMFAARVPLDAVLDCEVVVDDLRFDMASGLLRSYTPLANEYNLTLRVFDALNIGELKLVSRSPQYIRRDPYITSNTRLDVVKRRAVNSMEDVYHLFELAREEGHEGVVVKDPGQIYTGSKVKGWFKLKPKETADGIVIGFVDGSKGNAGKYVGFIVKLEDGTTCNATGITQALMDEVTTNPNDYLGRYVEVERMESTGEGNSRHPHFKCFRDMEGSKGVKA